MRTKKDAIIDKYRASDPPFAKSISLVAFIIRMQGDGQSCESLMEPITQIYDHGFEKRIEVAL